MERMWNDLTLELVVSLHCRPGWFLETHHFSIFGIELHPCLFAPGVAWVYHPLEKQFCFLCFCLLFLIYDSFLKWVMNDSAWVFMRSLRGVCEVWEHGENVKWRWPQFLTLNCPWFFPCIAYLRENTWLLFFQHWVAFWPFGSRSNTCLASSGACGHRLKSSTNYQHRKFPLSTWILHYAW